MLKIKIAYPMHQKEEKTIPNENDKMTSNLHQKNQLIPLKHTQVMNQLTFTINQLTISWTIQTGHKTFTPDNIYFNIHQNHRLRMVNSKFPSGEVGLMEILSLH